MLTAYPLLSSDIPPEPKPPGVSSPEFVDWGILPNGMFRFDYDLDLDGKIDYYTDRRIKPSGYGSAKTQAEAIAEIPNWPGSLFIYYFDGGIHEFRWFAIERYPLFYGWNGITYKDMEEDSLNGNEDLYDQYPKSDRII